MTKTAVVYDKWLQSLGGGEMVACVIAKILKDSGYEVTFICGKNVGVETIKHKLGIELKGIKFLEIWNNEAELRRIVSTKDLFVNVSYMDYTRGDAKRNIYYTHFPTDPLESIKSIVFNKIILPFVSLYIKPIEFVNEVDVISLPTKELAYLLKSENKIAISYLNTEKNYTLGFSLFLENFNKDLLQSLKINFYPDEVEVLDKTVFVDHHKNKLIFKFKIKPKQSTIYTNINFPRKSRNGIINYVYLLYPKMSFWEDHTPFIEKLHQRINTRLRAGIFNNTLNRLKTYDAILSNSQFTKRWVKNYWKRNSIVLYPPVTSLLDSKISNTSKQNWICSVGRFFTLGHGKKQEILIQAFKRLYDKGYTDWELHLIGGVGNETSSVDFVKKLKLEAQGYPIYFHFNASRKEVEDICLKSKIYWHAAGFGENEDEYPIRFEHFGIAPLEAISAKAIPILFNGGGLREVITGLGLPPEKHLFKSIEELVNNTINFINIQDDSFPWNSVLANFRKNYALQSFEKHFKEILNS